MPPMSTKVAKKPKRPVLDARLSARCEQTLLDRVERIAAQAGIDPADVIRIGLRFGLPLTEKRYARKAA